MPTPTESPVKITIEQRTGTRGDGGLYSFTDLQARREGAMVGSISIHGNDDGTIQAHIFYPMRRSSTGWMLRCRRLKFTPTTLARLIAILTR